MVFDSDLAFFFNTSEFAESAIITPSIGDPINLKVQFSRSDLTGNFYTGDSEQENSFVICLESDLSALPSNQRTGEAVLSVGGKDYKLVSVSPDGTGTAMLALYDPDSTT